MLAGTGRAEDTGCRKAKIIYTEPGSESKTGSNFRDSSQPEDGCWCPESGDGGIMEREKEKKISELGEFAQMGCLTVLDIRYGTLLPPLGTA